jgi:uncharacterized protein (TIGR03435 family)
VIVKARLLSGVGIVALAVSVAVVLAAQPPASPAFERASIKTGANFVRYSPLLPPPRPVTRTVSFQSGRFTAGFTAVNASLHMLLDAAYRGASPPQVGPVFKVLGGPDWTTTDGFDIDATAQGDPPLDQMELMLRTLLTDRFALRTHEETRELPTYRLVMARKDRKLGPQLRPSACVNTPPSAPPDPSGLLRCADRFGSHLQGGDLAFSAATMDQLAAQFARMLRTPVYNQTGLAGTFDVDMESEPGSSESIFDLMPKQLGLKLQSSRGPVDVLVIDHVEQPSPD